MDDTTRNPKDIRSKEEISGKNVIIYLNMASMSPPIELHSAVVQDLLSRGNKVTAYICDGSFLSPTENPFNRTSIEKFKMFRAKDALKGLGVDLRIINLRDISESVSEKTGTVLELAVMSSFASLLKVQSKEELGKKWLVAHDNMLRSAKRLYNFFLSEIQKERCDFVFMFNGRFGDVRPVLEATKDSSIGFGLHEVKRVINEIVFINELVHSIEGNTRRALNFYEENPERAEVNAQKFFKNKTENKPTGDPIYTKNQDKGSLPDAIVNTTKKVIAVYPTTDDEYKFIGKEWDGYVPEDQVHEIEKLADSLSPKNYIVVVKMHPNQATTPEHTLKRYFNLAKKYSHVVVEGPLSKKDTYALMHRAEVVVTFASTIGVEACYSGKPVILIGDTNWGKMNVAHKVYSGEEAGVLIQKGAKPKPVLGAIIWGNYMLSYKDKLSELQIVEQGNYLVAGRRIGKSTRRRILQLPAKLEITAHKPGFKWRAAFILTIGTAILNIVKGTWAAD